MDIQVFFAEFLSMQVVLPLNPCIPKYSYSIAEYLHIQAFLPHSKTLVRTNILTVSQNTLMYEYFYHIAEYLYLHIGVFLPCLRILAYPSILTVSQNTFIYEYFYLSQNTWISKYSYRIAEYLHIQAFLPHSRILANTGIFTISQNTCIHEYFYRMAEYLHIRILLGCSRIIVYASILRSHTASTGTYSPAFRRSLQTS